MERGAGTCRTDASPHSWHALHQEQHRAPADSGALHPPVAMECPALPIVLPAIPHQIAGKGRIQHFFRHYDREHEVSSQSPGDANLACNIINRNSARAFRNFQVIKKRAVQKGNLVYGHRNRAYRAGSAADSRLEQYRLLSIQHRHSELAHPRQQLQQRVHAPHHGDSFPPHPVRARLHRLCLARHRPQAHHAGRNRAGRSVLKRIKIKNTNAYQPNPEAFSMFRDFLSPIFCPSKEKQYLCRHETGNYR